MRNFKLFTMIFALMATICFAACDDKDDSKQETNACEPASCNVDNATEAGCDAGQCVAKACKDGFRVSDDKKSCEEVKESPKCDHAATTACDPKCEDGVTKCECTMEVCACVPVTPAPTCNPSCDQDTQDCVCSDSGCECKTKDAPVDDKCKDKSDGEACDENKTCQKGEGDKLECKDAPAKDPE